MKDLRDISLYLLDMDGTIYLGDRVFDCTLPFLSLLREQGKHYIFLTNNCTRNRYAYFDRLEKHGHPVEPDGVFTSGEATTIYLNRQKPGARIYLLGTPSPRRSFAKRALSLTDRRLITSFWASIPS